MMRPTGNVNSINDTYDLGSLHARLQLSVTITAALHCRLPALLPRAVDQPTRVFFSVFRDIAI